MILEQFGRDVLLHRASHIQKIADTYGEGPLIVVGQGGSIYPLKTLRDASSIADLSLMTHGGLPRDIFESEQRLFLVSRTGKTREVLDYLSVLQQDVSWTKKHCSVITQTKEESPLLRFAKSNDLTIFPVDGVLTGRYSFLDDSTVIPFAVGGGNVAAFFRAVEDYRCDATRIDAWAEKLVGALREAKNILVMIYWEEKFAGLTDYTRQIFGESLGKGNKCFTPMISRWPEDLHTVFQLLADGPKDKYLMSFFENANEKDYEVAKGMLAAYHKFNYEDIKLRAFADIVHWTLDMLHVSLVVAKKLGINPLGQDAIEERKRLGRL